MRRASWRKLSVESVVRWISLVDLGRGAVEMNMGFGVVEAVEAEERDERKEERKVVEARREPWIKYLFCVI